MSTGKIILSAIAASLLIVQSVNAVEPFENIAHDMLKDSIAMRTVSGPGNETPEFAAYLADKFKKAGFPDQDIMIIPYEDTAAMIVRYRGDNSSDKKPFVLSSHLDVVEALPEDWEKNPFELIEQNGMLYGRGVLDTKLNVVTLTATFLRLKSEGFIPSRDIILVFSGDEETAMASTRLVTQKYRDQIDAEFAIIADGGGGNLDENGKAFSYSIDSAEKTYADYEVTARNPGGHSSLPRKDNAIYDLARAIVKLSEFEFPVMQSPLTKAYFEKTAKLESNPEISKAMAAFAKNKNDMDAVKVLRSYPQYAGMTGTTCVATLLKGGHAQNALPQSAMMSINCRIFPGVGSDATMAQLKKVLDNDNLEWHLAAPVDESDESPLNEEVFSAVERVVHDEFPGIPIIPTMAMGASDGMYFRIAGIPSYALTADFIKPSDVFAHGLNERNPSANLGRAMRLWYKLINEWAG
ncbi:MAG: M20/M25/M40 family metallo-hydrolase [Kordiimonadaceae bacterium]|nr:M20/M25/M40 family metallo-hydrolase [Kordiimonadaceae bacterium]